MRLPHRPATAVLVEDTFPFNSWDQLPFNERRPASSE